MPKWFGGSTLNPDELISRHEQWRLQWDRVQRWYARVRELADTSKYNRLTQGDLDVVIAYFQNAFHLRDWILACHPELQSQLNSLFQTQFEMGACRDICNGFKHKSLTHPSHDAFFNIYQEFDPFQEEIDSTRNFIGYRAAFSNGNDLVKFDLFELADRCFETWTDFIAAEVVAS